MTFRHPLILVCSFLLATPGITAELLPRGVFLQGGLAEHATGIATAGAIWPWSLRRELWGGEVGGLTEAFLSHWSARGNDGRVSFTQVGVLPLLRYRFDRGRSPWFIEGGIGLTAMDRVYRTRSTEFSTTFNFVDVAGVGRSFGERRSQELSLRISHVSNAGIKHPNPGENLLQLRYARMF